MSNGTPSTLSTIVSGLESSGGANVASQPSTMVNPTYGQYSGFVQQYGNGAAGVDNYAQQMLAANPNATLGDFYSGYALSTADPANPPGVDALQAQNNGAYQNLVNNSGYSPDTPLSSLVSTPQAEGATDASSGLNAGTTSYVDPTNAASAYGGSAVNLPGSTPAAGSSSSSTWGFAAIAQAIDTSFQSMIQGIENWFTRGFLILIGLALVIVGLLAIFGKQAPLPVPA